MMRDFIKRYVLFVSFLSRKSGVGGCLAQRFMNGVCRCTGDILRL
jgi:hypothetical protein